MAFSNLLVKGENNKFVKSQVMKAWFILFTFLIVVHSFFPFIPGHDDEAYYIWSSKTTGSFFTDLISIDRFIFSFTQPGYAWVNSIVSHFTGGDLFSFKLINVFIFILLIPIWFRIGEEIESKVFARKLSAIIILAFPLWFYSSFMLKDITIVFLQNSALLIIILLHKKLKIYYIVLLILNILLTLLYRSPLILVVIAILVSQYAVPIIIGSKRKIKIQTKIFYLVFGVGFVYLLWALVTNSTVLDIFGVFNDSNNIASEEFQDAMKGRVESQQTHFFTYLIKYFVSETSGFHLMNYFNFTPYTLRGLLAVPWILFGVPFFIIGMLMQFSKSGKSIKPTLMVNQFSFLHSKWLPVVSFIIIYLILGYVANDSTRYRMPDIPSTLAVALYGWLALRNSMKSQFLFIWLFFGFLPLLLVIFN